VKRKKSLEQDLKFRKTAGLIVRTDEKDEVRQRLSDERKAERPKSKPKPSYNVSRPTKDEGIRSAPVFVREFRKQVSERFPKAKFLPNQFMETETAAATEAIDLLYERGCESRQTAISWMRWFVAKKMTEKDTWHPVTVRMLKKSWVDFVKVKPNDIAERGEAKPPSDAIGLRMKEIFGDGGPTLENIARACCVFGLVLVANYLTTYLHPVPAFTVIDLMNDAIAKLNARTMHTVFCSTCRYAVGKATDPRMILLDWERRYPQLLPPSEAGRPSPAETQKGYVDRFIDANGILERRT
jgi:hypothetical protein